MKDFSFRYKIWHPCLTISSSSARFSNAKASSSSSFSTCFMFLLLLVLFFSFIYFTLQQRPSKPRCNADRQYKTSKREKRRAGERARRERTLARESEKHNSNEFYGDNLIAKPNQKPGTLEAGEKNRHSSSKHTLNEKSLFGCVRRVCLNVTVHRVILLAASVRQRRFAFWRDFAVFVHHPVRTSSFYVCISQSLVWSCVWWFERSDGMFSQRFFFFSFV